MAGARALVLDSYLELSDERPRLRYRVAERAAGAVHEIRSRFVSPQFHSIPAAAGAGIQFVYTARRSSQGVLAMDVAFAHRLHIPPAGRQHRK